MKKLTAIVSAFALAALMALSVCACTTPSPSPSGASTSAAAATSSSSAPTTQTSSVAAQPSPMDDSYAENHLVDETYIPPEGLTVKEKDEYTDKDHVALYIHLYGTVPSNFVSKTKARNAGWVNTKGNLWDVLPGKSIGGGGFYNDDNTMPDADGRDWFECDIDYDGGFRNSKRIVYSNDGLIYYTDDHYNTFQRLY